MHEEKIGNLQPLSERFQVKETKLERAIMVNLQPLSERFKIKSQT